MVAGSHSYASVGAYTVSVSVNDSDGSSGTVTSTADVGNLFAGVTSTLSVASFKSSDPNATAGQFTATVNWGDGNSSAGTIVETSGTFVVSGTHDYTVDSYDQAGGQYTLSVTVNGPQSEVITTSPAVSVVRPADVAFGNTLFSQPNVSFTNSPVAVFADPDTADAASEFSATIFWGDGTSSTGTISGSNGLFSVLGGHTYTAAGEYGIGVAVSQGWSTFFDGFEEPAKDDVGAKKKDAVVREYTVNSLGNGTSGDINTRSGTLKWCIEQSNENPGDPSNVIKFADNLKGGTILLASQMPAIKSSVEIIGNDNTIERSLTANAFRILTILGANTVVSISKLTFSNGNSPTTGGGVYNEGHLSMSQCGVVHNRASGNGGGIYSTGELALTNCEVVSNRTTSGPPPFFGGGVCILAGQNNLIRYSTIADNCAPHGGGIFISNPKTILDGGPKVSLEINGSAIESNISTIGGGGISASGINTSLGITNTTIYDNNSNSVGGGMCLENSQVSMQGGNITNNKAFNSDSSNGGGGIWVADPAAKVTLNTV